MILFLLKNAKYKLTSIIKKYILKIDFFTFPCYNRLCKHYFFKQERLIKNVKLFFAETLFKRFQ